MTTDHHSFVNSFWGQNDAGIQVIQQKIKHSSNTIAELLGFYEEKIRIEKEYNKRLTKLSENFPLGSNETGSLKLSLDKLSMENNAMIQYNHKFTRSVSLQNYDKLLNFQTIYNKKMHKLESHMMKISHKRKEAFKTFEAYKNRYKDECLQIKSLRFQCQGTWGKELERLEQKLNKLLNGNAHSKKNYIQSCSGLQEMEEIYIRDWSAILRDFYQLEAERIQICKVNCFSYCNSIATLCVENDQSVDNARSIFAQITPNEDLHTFSANYGTGDKIYQPPEFIEFMDGLEDKPANLKYVHANFENPEYLVRSQSMHIPVDKTKEADDYSECGIVTSSPRAKPFTPAASPQHSPTQKYTPRVLPPGQRKQQQQQQRPISPDHSPTHSVPPTATTLQPVNLPPPSPNQFVTKAMNGGGSYSPITENGAGKGFTVPKTPSPVRRSDQKSTTSTKTPSNYSSGSNDVFSLGNEGTLNVVANKFRDSGGSSNYSNPTTNYASSNYSSYSTTSNDRNWATPRKKEIQQVKKFQDRINLNAKELPTFPEQNPTQSQSQHKFQQQYQSRKSISGPPPKHVPIQKDFSIDFIAKALEDLNSGGNGDINQYRRSVRRAKEAEEEGEEEEKTFLQPLSQATTTVNSQGYINNNARPAADFVDDHDEVATRYGSINFHAPSVAPALADIESVVVNKSGSVRRRPKSMFEPTTTSNDEFARQSQIQMAGDAFTTPSKSARKPQRSLLKTPSKSYTNLHSFIQDTPAKPARNDSGFTPTGKPYVSKVKAMYTYKPQHHGELYFKKNWYLYVLHMQEDNWYVCELASEPGAGTIGLVPGNYVKEDFSF